MAAESEIQERIFEKGGALSTGYQAAIRDGTIDAFLRQGANELGAALKAFPDTLQVDEPGAVFNPLYSDIAADKRMQAQSEPSQAPAKSSLPSPSEIARGNDTGSVHGDSKQAAKDLPSPGQIASEPSPAMPQQDQGIDHAQGHGRGR